MSLVNSHNIYFKNKIRALELSQVNYRISAAMEKILGTQERVDILMVNEPSVFEPLTFYCS